MTQPAPLLYVESLTQHFRSGSHTTRAMDDVDLDVVRGETLGLVGESGCGKSTLARAVVLLRRPTSGRIVFDGLDVTNLRGGALRRHRQRAQMVFQDPHDSLDPTFTVGKAVGEPLRAAGLGRTEVRRRSAEALEQVGMPADVMNRKPHEFSGGQRQRMGIARAISTRPDLLVLDEPTSALDVSIQAQILNLLVDLQRRDGLSYLFISHNLAVVRHVAHRVAVMYLGRVVEVGPAVDVLDHPLHPYTYALRSAVPTPKPTERRARVRLRGELPSSASPVPGCAFASRCWRADDRCRQERPALTQPAPGILRRVACHYPLEDGSAALAYAADATSLNRSPR